MDELVTDDEIDNVVTLLIDWLKGLEESGEDPILVWMKAERVHKSALTAISKQGIASLMDEDRPALVSSNHIESVLAMSFLIGWETHKRLRLRSTE